MDFTLVSDYIPTGDQPEAIRKLVNGLNEGEGNQTLLGVTGSGKTFTMANVIAKVQKPTLVLCHNKTLAAQLYGEFKSFFPELKNVNPWIKASARGIFSSCIISVLVKECSNIREKNTI